MSTLITADEARARSDAARKMLRRAAANAGYDVYWHDQWQCFVHKAPFNTDNPPTLAPQRHVWVPLHDDGDALRLAVKLGMAVDCNPAGFTECILSADCTAKEDHAGDPMAATRLAIVRAAAARPL